MTEEEKARAARTALARIENDARVILVGTEGFPIYEAVNIFLRSIRDIAHRALDETR